MSSTIRGPSRVTWTVKFARLLLRTRDGTTMSLVISLQGRATGHTEAFVTLEPLDLVRGPLPNVSDLTDLVVSQLR